MLEGVGEKGGREAVDDGGENAGGDCSEGCTENEGVRDEVVRLGLQRFLRIYCSRPWKCPISSRKCVTEITAFRDAVGRAGDMGGRRSTSADMYRSGVDRLCRLWSAEVDRPQPRQTDLADHRNSQVLTPDIREETVPSACRLRDSWDVGVFGRAEESERGLRASDNADGMDCREDKLEDEDDTKESRYCELNNGAQKKETKGLVNDYPGMAHQSHANSYLEGAERRHHERSGPEGWAPVGVVDGKIQVWIARRA
ncbi:hypothetical protein B0H13DRAFT_1919314 [Mycena leptocephala]|nr:hypothetical protein B0H13DRAFT_1919314 [Mycena leptocephala]